MKLLIKQIIYTVKFDLYITTDTYKKMEYIQNYVKNYSKANNYYIIKVVDNSKKDVFPLLIQMKEIIYFSSYSNEGSS